MSTQKYLALQNKVSQSVCGYPVELANNVQTRKHPPRVADVLELLWPSVEAAIGQLALSEPPAKRVCVNEMQCVEDGERGDAAEDLAGM